MTQSRLHAAQNALAKLHEHRGNTCYPHFHLAPPAGWMNDPNGLIWFNDPMSEHWGPMHWGHATSDDMIHWQHEPIALAPGDDNDKDGCFSGSAVDDNGVLSLIYTGHVWLDGAGNDDAIREVQCLATSRDGIHFEKQGVILTPPEGIMHFRDPKVWREADTWWMVVGAKDPGNTGQILLYRGSSLREWTFDRVLAHADAGESYMWECPDYFEVDGTKILSASVQGLEGGIWDDRNVYQSGYFLVDGDILEDYKLSEYQLWDYGFDYYAPQSFETEDGRRIHISWMGMPDCEEYTNPTIAEGWQHCFTFPREVFVEDGKVCQRPVRELQKKKTLVDKSAGMLKKDGYKVYDVNISGIQNNEFRTVIDEELILEYKNGRFEMHFTSQDKNSVSAGRGMRYIALDSVTDVEILVDHSSVEVFVNDGEAVFSTRFYPKADSLLVEAEEAQIMMYEIQ